MSRLNWWFLGERAKGMTYFRAFTLMLGLTFSFKYQLIFSPIRSSPLLINNYMRYYIFKADTRISFMFTAFVFDISVRVYLSCYLQPMRACSYGNYSLSLQEASGVVPAISCCPCSWAGTTRDQECCQAYDSRDNAFAREIKLANQRTGHHWVVPRSLVPDCRFSLSNTAQATKACIEPQRK